MSVKHGPVHPSYALHRSLSFWVMLLSGFSVLISGLCLAFRLWLFFSAEGSARRFIGVMNDAGYSSFALSSYLMLAVFACALLGYWGFRRSQDSRKFWSLFKLLPVLGEAPHETALQGRKQLETAVHHALREDKPGMAERLLNNQLALFSQDPAIWHALGHVRAHAGDAEALAAFERSGLFEEKIEILRKLLKTPRFHQLGSLGQNLLPLSVLAFFILPILGGMFWLGLQAAEVVTENKYEGRHDVGEFFYQKGLNFEETDMFKIYYSDPYFKDECKQALGPIVTALSEAYNYGSEQVAHSKWSLYLCANKDEFFKRAPFMDKWAAGCFAPSMQSLFFYNVPGNDYHTSEVMAHELSHAYFDRVFKGIEEKSWLNEGTAMYFGTKLSYTLATQGSYLGFVNFHYFKDLKISHLPFSTFLEVSPHQLSNEADIKTFYMQGFSLVVLLCDYQGQGMGGSKRFVDFLRDYTVTKDINKALAQNYGPRINNMDDLQGMWLLFMTQKD
jgi:hypothetical protein